MRLCMGESWEIRALNKDLEIMLLSHVLHSITLEAAFGTINYISILTKRNRMMSFEVYKNLVNIRGSV